MLLDKLRARARGSNEPAKAVYRLHPVTFRYNKEVDPTQSLAFGLVAEKMAEVNPDLVARNSHGEAENVHYEMVNAMLLNEFLKEHRKVEALKSRIEKQEATISELKSIIAQQRKGFESQLEERRQAIKVLTAGLEKVSARLDPSTSAAKTVGGDQPARKRRNNKYESVD